MRYTNLNYDPQMSWRIGDSAIPAKSSGWASEEDVRDAFDLMIAITIDDPNTPSADDLVADAKDDLAHILFDDNGRKVILLPGNGNSRETRNIDTPAHLALAMNIHVMYYRSRMARYEKLLTDVVESIRKAKR